MNEVAYTPQITESIKKNSLNFGAAAVLMLYLEADKTSQTRLCHIDPYNCLLRGKEVITVRHRDEL